MNAFKGKEHDTATSMALLERAGVTNGHEKQINIDGTLVEVRLILMVPSKRGCWIFVGEKYMNVVDLLSKKHEPLSSCCGYLVQISVRVFLGLEICEGCLCL